MINGSILRKIKQTIMVWIKCKVLKEDGFRSKIGIDSLHESSNDYGVGLICLQMSIVVNSTYCFYKKYPYTDLNVTKKKMHNQMDHVIIDNQIKH